MPGYSSLCPTFRTLEKYEIEEYTPIFEPEDTFDNGPEDGANINTIKLLTNASSALHCILDSGAHRHIFTDETWLEDTSSLPQHRPQSMVFQGQ